jgi:hypothetical protein
MPEFNFKNLPGWALPALVTVAIGLTMLVAVLGISNFANRNDQVETQTAQLNSIGSPPVQEEKLDVNTILDNAVKGDGNITDQPNTFPIDANPKNNISSKTPVVESDSKPITATSNPATKTQKAKEVVCDVIVTYNKPVNSNQYQEIAQCQPKDGAFLTNIESLLRVKATNVTNVDKNNYAILGNELKEKIPKLMKSTLKDGKFGGVQTYDQIGFEYNNNLYLISMEPKLQSETQPIINITK